VISFAQLSRLDYLQVPVLWHIASAHSY